jgi:succinate-acetate transporter protein
MLFLVLPLHNPVRPISQKRSDNKQADQQFGYYFIQWFFVILLLVELGRVTRVLFVEVLVGLLTLQLFGGHLGCSRGRVGLGRGGGWGGLFVGVNVLLLNVSEVVVGFCDGNKFLVCLVLYILCIVLGGFVHWCFFSI